MRTTMELELELAYCVCADFWSAHNNGISIGISTVCERVIFWCTQMELVYA